MTLNGLQLPVGTTHLGFIEKIDLSGEKNNSNNAQKDNTKFQLADEPIEYTRDLIAVRNVNSDNLASMLELEGMPSPSIAITKDSIGHTQFGDVTFIFGRNTIDPEADSRNMVGWDEVKLAVVPADIECCYNKRMTCVISWQK